MKLLYSVIICVCMCVYHPRQVYFNKSDNKMLSDVFTHQLSNRIDDYVTIYTFISIILILTNIRLSETKYH